MTILYSAAIFFSDQLALILLNSSFVWHHILLHVIKHHECMHLKANTSLQISMGIETCIFTYILSYRAIYFNNTFLSPLTNHYLLMVIRSNCAIITVKNIVNVMNFDNLLQWNGILMLKITDVCRLLHLYLSLHIS